MTNKIEIAPLAGALGAEIYGVDLTRSLTNQEFAEIMQAFLDYQVIFFRDQHDLSPEQHKAFASRFGSLNVHPYVAGMAEHPELLEIIKEPEDKLNFGGGWHSDMSFLEVPALGSILYALEVPQYGGDTLFASQSKAYDALSDGMKDMLSGLSAVHSASREYSAKGASAQARSSMQSTQVQEAPEYEHPVVRTHPQTGRKGALHKSSLYASFLRYDEAREQTIARFPVRTFPGRAIYVPIQVAEGIACVLGQSLLLALRFE
jgi:taurine dioxygenase